jgi:RNase P/RNase MRP subunit p29
MKPTKVGQVVKFHTPYPDEDPNQLYVIIEIKGDDDTTRVDIKALHTGFSFPPISTVLLKDLITVELPTEELIGHEVTIVKSDKTMTKGRVTRVSDSKVNLDLNKVAKGVTTNVFLTVVDKNGTEVEGTLFVN